MDFKTKSVMRHHEGHYVMIKGSVQQEDITIVNICVQNIGTPKYIKQILIDEKGETDRDFNTSLKSVDRSSRQKIKKKTIVSLNETDHMDLTHLYECSIPKIPTEYTFFSSAHATFSRTDHMLCHKTSLNKF